MINFVYIYLHIILYISILIYIQTIAYVYRAELNASFGVSVPYRYDNVFEYFEIPDKKLLDKVIYENREQVRYQCGGLKI